MSVHPRLNGDNRSENETRKMRNSNRKRVNVDYEQFIRDWMEIYKDGGSRLDLCRKIDLSYEAVSGRFDNLKRRGVILPTLRTGNTMSNIQTTQLSNLISELSAPTPTTPGLKKPPVV
jgi:hypothetical protein